MKISVGINDRFLGEYPRYGAVKLPNNASQLATNSRLLDGNLGAWKNFLLVESLCKTDVATIYSMDNTYWLQWSFSELAANAVEVDVARSTTDDNGRIFLTGLDVPRWTDSTLVGGGSGCYPQQTRPLGVPNPSSEPTTTAQLGTAPPVDITDAGDEYSEYDRTTVINTPTQVSQITQYATGGNPGSRYFFEAKACTTNPTMWRDFGVGDATVVSMEVDIYIAAKNSYDGYAVAMGIGLDSGGGGPVMEVNYNPGQPRIVLSYNSSRTAGTTLASVAMTTLSVGVWYKLRLEATRQPDGTADCVASCYDSTGTTLLGQATGRARIQGGYAQMGISNIADTTLMQVNFDNIHIQASGLVANTADDYSTTYVYTWVNDLGEESGPSPASALIVKDDDTTVVVTTPTSIPTGYDYGIVSKRIYRALTTASGTYYFFLAEQLVWYQEYYDTTSNADLALNETLSTADYELPPTDLRGILVLPNDIYAGFSGRNLCLSARGQPHAWPIANRYAIDTDIVAIGAIDAQVVILGSTWPWLAAGNDPAVFSMNNTEIPQGCVSKRSVAYLKGIGVIYASPDGLVGVAGTGQVTLLTGEIFSRKEWQALDPTTLVAVAHDNRYIGFYSSLEGETFGFMLEAGTNGFGVVTLGFHASARFVDQATDRLYLVLDGMWYPECETGSAGSQPTANGDTIYAFDQYDGETIPSEGDPVPMYSLYMPRTWRSKKFNQPHLNCYRRACVRALDYTDVCFELYADGNFVFHQRVTDGQSFVLPDTDAMTIEFEIIGTSIVESVELAHDVEELEA